MARRPLGELLIEAGVLKAEQLQVALHEQQRWGGQLGKILVDKMFITEETLTAVLSKQLHVQVVKLGDVKISEAIIKMVPLELARDHTLIPFRIEGGKFLDVAMADPMNLGIVDELQIRTKLNVRPYLAPRSSIEAAIRRSYPDAQQFAGDVTAYDAPGFSVGGDSLAEMRDAEIASLQKRLATLEALVNRDENVIRKLLGLLVEKGLATREEILEAIK
jgi:type IV pilus assembly protein PilB